MQPSRKWPYPVFRSTQAVDPLRKVFHARLTGTHQERAHGITAVVVAVAVELPRRLSLVKSSFCRASASAPVQCEVTRFSPSARRDQKWCERKIYLEDEDAPQPLLLDSTKMHRLYSMTAKKPVSSLRALRPLEALWCEVAGQNVSVTPFSKRRNPRTHTTRLLSSKDASALPSPTLVNKSPFRSEWLHHFSASLVEIPEERLGKVYHSVAY